TRSKRDWSSDVCSSDLPGQQIFVFCNLRHPDLFFFIAEVEHRVKFFPFRLPDDPEDGCIAVILCIYLCVRAEDGVVPADFFQPGEGMEDLFLDASLFLYIFRKIPTEFSLVDVRSEEHTSELQS